MIRINLFDIDFIEAKSNYVAIHRMGTNTLVYATMQYFEDRLPATHFLRIHKSFIIATNKIKLIEKNYVVLNNIDIHLPISKTYKQILMDKVNNNLV